MLAAWRSLLGITVMYPLAYVMESCEASKEGGSQILSAINDWKSFSVLGMLMAGNVCGLMFAAVYLSALTISIMQPAVPAISAVLCISLGVEDISLMKIMSICLSVGGALIVLTHGEMNASLGAISSSDIFYGSFFIAMNVICSACYWVYQKNVLKNHPPVTATATAYLYAGGLILAVAFLKGEGLSADAWMMHGNVFVWKCMAYMILITTVFNYCVQGWANSQSSPTLVTLFMCLPPFFATIISALFLGTIISGGQLIGGITIVNGLVLNAKSQADVEQTERIKLVAETA
eukprot:gnl/MRDRNA2_/MRDRNA2_199097_c0_seq1.p1 gnl/MRDRNA2_/MRDRNA2_199097_c0~~gnl/MRDRNA2_/MRDRNA2_199097_c0_seq1.p1  ORF type:complete len:304 (-),score=48.07 gnl/MRDRNA2_/MRDRNA2_199097_c0_seq1:40-912(-)